MFAAFLDELAKQLHLLHVPVAKPAPAPEKQPAAVAKATADPFRQG
jgi:hypothetical protein